MALLTPLFVALLLFFCWGAFGRDWKRGGMLAAFEPPDGLGPAEFGALLDEKVHRRDIAAAIVNLGVKGYLAFHPVKEGVLIFQRDSVMFEMLESSEPITHFETALLAHLRTGGQWIDSVAIRKYVAPHMNSFRQGIYRELVLCGYYHVDPRAAKVTWSIVGIALAAGISVGLHMLSGAETHGPAFVGAVIGAVVALAFAQIMPQRTYAGTKAWSQAKGFESFLSGRTDYHRWYAEAHPTQATFEKYLPYAVAVNRVDTWAELFRETPLLPPDWYREYEVDSIFLYGAFVSDLRGLTDGLDLATDPRRSAARRGGGDWQVRR